MRRRLRIAGRRRHLGGRRVRRSRQHERARAGEQVAARRHERRAADPRARDEQPRRGEGAERRAEHVDPVERADRAPGRAHVAQHRPHQERQRHAHEQRGRQQCGKVREAGGERGTLEPRGERVEPVVIEEGAGGSEGGDRELDEREEAQRRARLEPRAQPAAELAADPEPGHEGRHDHRDRVEPDAAVEREDALPGDLVDERRSAAQQEQEPGEEDTARFRRRQKALSA